MGRQDNSNLVGEKIAAFLLEERSSLSFLVRWFKYTLIELRGGGAYLIKPSKPKHSASRLFRHPTSFSVCIFCKLERSHVRGIVDLLHFAAGLYSIFEALRPNYGVCMFFSFPARVSTQVPVATFHYMAVSFEIYS